MNATSIRERVERVRSLFDAYGIDGFLFTTHDSYIGETVAENARRLAWLTGFSGSSAVALLLRDNAAVFSDGRYTTQMREELDPNLWQNCHIVKDPVIAWLETHASGQRLGYDPKCMTESCLKSVERASVKLIALKRNPIDEAWTDQPFAPHTQVIAHPLDLSGCSSVDKRADIAKTLRDKGCDAALIAQPASLAWLLNVRASDVPFTPLLLAHAILHADARCDIFVDKARLSEDVLKDFAGAVDIYPPEMLEHRLSLLKGQRVSVDPTTCSVWFLQTLQKFGALVLRADDPCVMPRACKNAVEIHGALRAHREDGLALCRFLHWISEHGIGQTESALAEKLARFRATSSDYRGESFAAISAVGPSAALPHYHAIPGRERTLESDEVYLIDSGGQYPFGTTDVTRTIWSGPSAPPRALRDAFTRVLEGHITLARARFPQGTPGYRLDALARYALWQAGLDYDHGTGHGVGSYLCVHEGPQSISLAARAYPLRSGMIVSNEPGFYAEEEFGIRLENLLLVSPSAMPDHGGFLAFDVLTYAPFDRQLILPKGLSAESLKWLNWYHEQTWEQLSPSLDEPTKAWLKLSCAPL